MKCAPLTPCSIDGLAGDLVLIDWHFVRRQISLIEVPCSVHAIVALVMESQTRWPKLESRRLTSLELSKVL